MEFWSVGLITFFVMVYLYLNFGVLLIIVTQGRLISRTNTDGKAHLGIQIPMGDLNLVFSISSWYLYWGELPSVISPTLFGDKVASFAGPLLKIYLSENKKLYKLMNFWGSKAIKFVFDAFEDDCHRKWLRARNVTHIVPWVREYPVQKID